MLQYVIVNMVIFHMEVDNKKFFSFKDKQSSR